VRLAIDIDSTLHPYWDQLAEIAHRRFNIELPYETQYTWAIDQLQPEQLKACVTETHRAENVLAAEPYPGAVETIQNWHAQGHFIHITSHRATDAHPHTSEWLTNIGLPHDELYCSYDKIARCLEIGIDVLIDDAPTTLAQARKAGIIAATLEHPWNKDVEDVIIAKDWAGLAQRLKPVLA
jgi:methionine salvage enolase-phosphatase E1